MNGAMNGNPILASHMAEIDARFESHLAAIRDRAAHAREVIRGAAETLESSVPRRSLDLSRVPVEEPPAYSQPQPRSPSAPVYDDSIIPDAPIGAVAHHASPPPALEDISLDDDGIPLWQD